VVVVVVVVVESKAGRSVWKILGPQIKMIVAWSRVVLVHVEIKKSDRRHSLKSKSKERILE
jgi:hypothetical protein